MDALLATIHSLEEWKMIKKVDSRAGAAFVLATLMMTAACGSSEDSSGGSSDDTFSISGNLSVETLASARIRASRESRENELRDIIADAHGLPSSPRSTLAATQCGDGNFYQVYCLSFSEPPVAAMGAVDCAASGAFTVSGLPVDSEIGCFVRSSTTETGTYATVGTIELPSASTLTGTSGSFVASGDVKFNVTLSSDGSIVATVVDGGNISSDAATSFDSSKLNGSFSLNCLTEAEAGDAFPQQSQCQGSPGTFDMAVYTATLQSAIDESASGGPKFNAGDTVDVVTVWMSGAKGSGGEGLATMNGLLSWSPASATTAVDWSEGSGQSIPNPFGSGTLTVTLPTVPTGMNYEVWQTYIDGVISAVAGAGTVTCYKMDGTSTSTLGLILADPFCFAQASNQIFERLTNGNSSLNLPKVRQEWLFGNTSNRDANQIQVDGLRADYSGDWTDSSDYSAVNFQNDGPSGAMPSGRRVMSMVEKNGSTGTFFSRGGYADTYRCVASGANADEHEVNADGCADHSLQCFINEETRIDVRAKSGSSTDLRGVVTMVKTAVGGDMKGATAYTGATEPAELCKSLISESTQFLVDFVKQ